MSPGLWDDFLMWDLSALSWAMSLPLPLIWSQMGHLDSVMVVLVILYSGIFVAFWMGRHGGDGMGGVVL